MPVGFHPCMDSSRHLRGGFQHLGSLEVPSKFRSDPPFYNCAGAKAAGPSPASTTPGLAQSRTGKPRWTRPFERFACLPLVSSPLLLLLPPLPILPPA
jgi:hypothetical protein